MAPPKPDSSLRQVRALVSGRVQGVGFRYFVQREATARGLAGWTRNLAAGQVEVVARGEADAVDGLVARLWEGPPLARVDHVALEGQAPDPSLTGFRLQPTRW
jgi:acylphosphatase